MFFQAYNILSYTRKHSSWHKMTYAYRNSVGKHLGKQLLGRLRKKWLAIRKLILRMVN